MYEMTKIEKIFKVKPPIRHSLSTPQRQSAEAVEDYTVKKVVNTQEGTVEKVPVADNDIANKKYVDDINDFDIAAVGSHLHKILKVLEEKRNAIIQLQNILKGHYERNGQTK